MRCSISDCSSQQTSFNSPSFLVNIWLDRDSLKSGLIKGWETLVFLSVSNELLHLASAETITFGLCVQSITLSPPAIIEENQNTNAVSQCRHLQFCQYIRFGNKAERISASNMSVPLAVSSVGTLILSLAGSELSYECPVIIFTNRPAGCLKEWKDQLCSNSMWNFCFLVHAKDKSLQKDGIKRKFKVCRENRVLKCAINQ